MRLLNHDNPLHHLRRSFDDNHLLRGFDDHHLWWGSRLGYRHIHRARL
jgi:hypothetical protein